MNFIILAAGRSGSTLLVNSLSSHPNVRCHHEPFNQHGWHPDLSDKKSPDEALSYLSQKGLSIPLHIKAYSYSQHFIGRHRGKVVVDPFKKKSSVLHEGFKITWAQAASMISSLENWLSKNEQVRCLFLYRHDYLSRFVSYQTAHASGVWNSSYKKVTPESLNVSPTALQKFVDAEIKVETQLLRMLGVTGINLSALSYEDLSYKPLKVVNDQLNFLGCKSLPQINLTTHKVINKPIEDIVQNFSDLPTEELNRSGHEHRLEILEKIQNK